MQKYYRSFIKFLAIVFKWVIAMDNKKILAVSAILILVVSVGVIGGTTHEVEAKAKTSTIKVYVDDIDGIFHKETLKVCIASDDGCLSKATKTVDLRKLSDGGDKSKVQVGIFKIKFSSNPDDEFGPSDVSACGKLSVQGLSANDCAYASLKKVKSNQYKATIDYQDLSDRLYDAEG